MKQKCASKSDQGGKGKFPLPTQGIDQDGSFRIGFSDAKNKGLSPLYEEQEHQDGSEEGYNYEPVLLQNNMC